MTYPEAIAALAHYRRIGAKFGLENIAALLRHLGNPHHGLPFIHIAGTNGKGSTAAFLHNLLNTLGYRTGLYTSPHILSIRERIRLGDTLISRDAFAHYFYRIHSIASRHSITPTFFETLTLLAILYYADTKPDFIVWETGLGGRLDATNIVAPILTLITPIGYDHQEYLGSTLTAIAAEKAGIIKPHIPLAFSKQEPEARAILIQTAQAQHAPFHESTLLIGHPTCVPTPPNYLQPATLAGSPFLLSLRGTHQIDNAALALQAALLLSLKQDRHTLIRAAQKAFAHTQWPGRLQILNPDPLTLLDGAHNITAINALVHSWQHTFRLPPARLIFSALSDKDLTAITRALAPITAELHIVPLPDPRAATIDQLTRAWHPIYPKSTDPWESLSKKLPHLTPHPTLITGSLRLVSEILATGSQSNPIDNEEYRLNDLLKPI
jgi:dihydrofolate synthase/folylpolyglutamate synthase